MRLVSVDEERDIWGRKKLHPVTQVLCPNALQLHGGHAHTKPHVPFMYHKAAGFFIFQES